MLPSIYVINAATLSKPRAVEQLAADLASYDTDVAIITETHFKARHSDNVISIPGYKLYRRDRQRHRGGGVAVYIWANIQSAGWTKPADDPDYELLWVHAGGVIIGALYHPPRASYSTHLLLNYIESCIEELSQEFPIAPVVLAGDFNQIPDCDIEDRTGMQQLVRQPTRGPNLLDRIFVSSHTYNIVRVVTSLIKSDHKAVVAYASQPAFANKSRTLKMFRTISPQQHAQFLAHISMLNLDDVGGNSTQCNGQVGM